MATRRNWLVVLAVVALVPILVLCIGYRFLPTWRDVEDPLGRPSTLSDGIIDSAAQFDILTARLDPKHQQLSQEIGVLRSVATDLAGLTGQAGKLSGLSVTLNTSTAAVASIASGLPDKIALLTQRSDTAAPTVSGLSSSIGGVTTQLERIDGGLDTVGASLATLGPRASSIARTLSYIEEEAEHVAELGPLLALLGPAVNGPKSPAPPDPGAPAPSTPTVSAPHPAPSAGG